MDLKVYQKETIEQPQGNVNVLKPGIIDIYPIFNDDGITLDNAELIDEREEVLQQAALTTIYQRGLDPIDIYDGIEWGEAMRGEVNPVQIMTELQLAVSSVSSTASISFNVIRDKDGVERLAFELNAV